MAHAQSDRHGHDVILTGLPRSGTTLTCHLLNKLADTVALHEPMDVVALGRTAGAAAACDEVARFLADTRHSLLTTGTAVSKHAAGQVPANSVGDKQADAQRKSIVARGSIEIDKPLSPGFLLCIKHPSAFTALLDGLRGRFRCYGIVRNPLAVLASWNSVQMPVGQGHIPAAEDLDAGLKAALAGIPDVAGRQLHLLDWFFSKYQPLQAQGAVIRYEEVIASGGRVLQAVTPAAAELGEPLTEKNANKQYDREAMRVLGRRLLESEGAWWDFYSREDVERLLERY